jgi:hypothetical protein
MSDFYIGYPPFNFGPKFETLEESLEFIKMWYKTQSITVEAVPSRAQYIVKIHDDFMARVAFVYVLERPKTPNKYPYGTFSHPDYKFNLAVWRSGMEEAMPLDTYLKLC